MSQSISVTVQLDEPCQENWNNMEPTEQGKFCNKCEKQVVDFTDFTDQQMLQHFLANPFPVCGRIRHSQRGQTFTNAAPKINRGLSPVAATLLTLTAIATEAKAHNTPYPVTIQQAQRANQSVSFTPADSVIISGTVKDEHGAPLENAEIVCGEIKLYSDKNGHFQFTLPTAVNKPAVIQFTHANLEPTVRSYHPVMGSTSYEVVLSQGYMPAGFMGYIEPFHRLNLPDIISTRTFRAFNKLDKQTRGFLDTLATLMRNNPDLTLSLRSYYKTSHGKAAMVLKLVKNYLVDSQGISEERFQLPKPQLKKQLTSGVIVEFRQPQPEE